MGIGQIAKTKEDMTHGMAVLEPRPQLGCKTASKGSSTSGAEDSRVRLTRRNGSDFVHAKGLSTETTECLASRRAKTSFELRLSEWIDGGREVNKGRTLKQESGSVHLA